MTKMPKTRLEKRAGSEFFSHRRFVFEFKVLRLGNCCSLWSSPSSLAIIKTRAAEVLRT